MQLRSEIYQLTKLTLIIKKLKFAIWVIPFYTKKVIIKLTTNCPLYNNIIITINVTDGKNGYQRIKRSSH